MDGLVFNLSELTKRSFGPWWFFSRELEASTSSEVVSVIATKSKNTGVKSCCKQYSSREESVALNRK